jgi:hypothetical protein
VSSFDTRTPEDEPGHVLESVRRKGVRLWLEDGELRYEAPKNALTPEDIERLRASRNRIIAVLQKSAGLETTEPGLDPRPQSNPAPLSYSQLAYWREYQLSERPGSRQVASAIRLHGRLNIDAMRRSLAEIVRRHEALRTRIVLHDGEPMQEIADSRDYGLKLDDLSVLSRESREVEVGRLIDEIILKPIDIAAEPLFEVRLLRLRDDEYVLIVAMEHLISDALSRSILLRDLLTAYVQASQRCPFTLPAIPVQFADYAVWERKMQRSWLERHASYWNQHLIGSLRIRFPTDQSLAAATSLGWGMVTLRISRDLKVEMREWCRLRRTTLAMTAFTAYVALVLRWSHVSEAIVLYQSDGRFSPKLENAIGYFASVLYLRVTLCENDTFIDLMNRVTREYCNAYEHADRSYMESQLPRPEFTRNSCFNWVPQQQRIDVLQDSEGAIACSPVDFDHPGLKYVRRDTEPMLLLFETDDEISGGVQFPVSRFSKEMMERFGRNFLVFITALLRQPDALVKNILLQ